MHTVRAAAFLIAVAYVWGAPPAAAQSVTIIEPQDLSSYPSMTLYLDLGAGEWAGGTGQARFDGGPTAEQVDAIAEARRLMDEASSKGQPLSWPSLPEPAETEAELVIKGFDARKGDVEGLLVVFLIDASPSMNGGKSGPWNQGADSPFKRVRSAIKATLLRIRAEDRVMLGRIAGALETVVAPTTKHRAVDDALDAFEFRSGQAKIVDATVQLLQDDLPRMPNPKLPARRLVMLFSDGTDTGSGIKLDPAQIGTVISRMKDPPALLTIGVGAGTRHYTDLQKIAVGAGSRDNFLLRPTPQDIESALARVLEAARRQVRVDFEAPKYFWRETRVEGALFLRPESGPEKEVVFSLDVRKLAADKATQGKTYVQAFEDNRQRVHDYTKELVDAEAQRVADEEEHSQRVILFSVGGGLLVLALLAFLLMARARSKRQLASQLAQRMALQEMQQKLEGRMEEQERAIIGEQAEARAEAEAAAAEAARIAAAAARTPLAVLIAVEGPLKGRRFALLRNPSVAGREAGQVDLAFPSEDGDMAISRVHAEFRQAERGWVVMALSKGHTEVNGTPLKQTDRYPVEIGDQILLGKTLFQFRAP